MSNKILVTDTLFIFDEHVKKLQTAGFEVERLDKSQASEEELCDAVKGKVGYILGGVEQVTQKVIDAANELKAIAFTGIDQEAYIPAWRYALEKGIKISNVPEGPTDAVAEWALGAALSMSRGFFELADGVGDKITNITVGLQDQTIGIIGLGRIGTRITELIKPFKPARVLYTSAHRHEDKEALLGIDFVPNMLELLSQCDIVFLGVPTSVGHNFFAAQQLAAMKNNALLVSFIHTGIINADDLYEALNDGRIRAISDLPVDARFSALPRSSWLSFKASNAYMTAPSLRRTSDVAANSLIQLLQTGTDQYLVS